MPFSLFRDASYGASIYHINLKDCLQAIHKAHELGFFNFADFDVEEYEHYEASVAYKVMNSFVPYKFTYLILWSELLEIVVSNSNDDGSPKSMNMCCKQVNLLHCIFKPNVNID